MPRQFVKTIYDEQYREQVFYEWYRLGCPALASFTPSPNGQGLTPSPTILSTWKNAERWDLRVEALNDLVAKKMDETVVNERVEMLRSHAEMGKKMAEIGMKYLDERGVEKSADAIRAVVEGTDIERNNRGLAENYLKIVQMSEKELDAEIKQILAGNEDNIIDATVVGQSDDAPEETDA